MITLPTLCLAILQSTDAPPPTSERHWLVIFIGVVALSLFINAIVTAVAGIFMMKTLKEVKELARDVHGKTSPILQKTHELIDHVGPKVRTITENMTQISYTVREKVDEVGETVSQVNRTVGDANQKTRGQVQHVDRMVSSALNTTEEVMHTIVHGIRVPIKQAAGMIAGLRTGAETLVRNFSNRGPGSGGNTRSGGNSGSAL